jgi:hypothetical protein
MPEKFHERFAIQINLDEAKRRFIARIPTSRRIVRRRLENPRAMI